MNRKKIVHIITRLDKGGSAENALITCRELDPEKYDVSLWYGCTSPETGVPPVPALEIPGLIRNIHPVRDIGALITLYTLLRKTRPDIIHTHSSKAGFIGRWAAKLAGINTILHTPHGHVFYGYEFGKLKTAFYLALERVSARISTKLVALTEGEKSESLDYGVGIPGQWCVVHSGVDTAEAGLQPRDDIRKSLFITPETLVIGTVARLEPVKGVDSLIAAAGLALKRPSPCPVRFLIVGDGACRGDMEREVRTRGLSDAFIFTGMRNDVFALMAAMDIYVQPSLNEGMGKTLIQAQAAGLPVVATRVQGIPDAVRENETGLLVPAGNAEKLADALRQLILSPGLRRKMGAASARWVNEPVDGLARFGTKRMIRLLEQLYDTL